MDLKLVISELSLFNFLILADSLVNRVTRTTLNNRLNELINNKIKNFAFSTTLHFRTPFKIDKFACRSEEDNLIKH